MSSRTRSAPEGFGKPVLRKEDARLLVGAGCYSDDVNLPGQAYACFVRSPHAHARIGRVETGAALATPGVIAVLTGADAAADGVKPLTHSPMPGNPFEDMVGNRDVSFIAPHPPMPADYARFVGEIVAMVIADTPAAARDGAERVVVDWTPLPAVTASVAASAAGAPIVYEGTASNVCVDAQVGDVAGGGRRLLARRPRGAAGDVGAAGHRRADGAARRGRLLGPGHWPLHRPRGRRGPGPDTDRRGRRARRAGERGARDGARGRRELRHAQQLLSGVRAGRLGGAARSAVP